MPRESSPNAAFAFVTEIKGHPYKLLRHHDVTRVVDGNEHDTVDPRLLVACLRLLPQLKAVASNEQIEIARQHLISHASAMDLDLTDESSIRKILNQKLSGKDGNDTINDNDGELTTETDTVVNKEDVAAEATLTSKPHGDRISEGPLNPTNKGGVDLQDTKDDVGRKGAKLETNEGASSPAHDDIVSVGPDDTKEPKGDVGSEMTVPNPGDTQKGEVVSEASADLDSEENTESAKEKKDSLKKKVAKKEKPKEGPVYGALKTGVTDGHSHSFSEGDNKTSVVDGHSHSVSKKDGEIVIGSSDGHSHSAPASTAQVGDWVRRNDGLVGVVQEVSEGGVIVKSPHQEKRISINVENWQVIVRANEVNKNDSTNLLKNEMRILNSPEALMKFATPTPEGQAGRKNAILFACVDDLTPVGRTFVMDRFQDAMAGKVEAKIQGIDKLGSVDFLVVKMGEDSDFPMTFMVDVARDNDGKPTRIRLLNSDLPQESFNDFAKFLKDLAKEAN